MFTAVIFGVYWLKVGGISTDPENWGHFGALLAGVVAVPGTLGTLALLWYTLSENRELHDQLLSLQKKNEISQEYREHREHFCKELEVVQDMYGKKVEFKYSSLAVLYRQLFPQHSFRNMSGEHDIVRLNERYVKIADLVRNVLRYDGLLFPEDQQDDLYLAVNELLTSLDELVSFVGLDFNAESAGDIHCFGDKERSIGLNIFKCEVYFRLISALVSAVNSFENVKPPSDIVDLCVYSKNLEPALWRYTSVSLTGQRLDYSVFGTSNESDGVMKVLLDFEGKYRHLCEEHPPIHSLALRMRYFFMTPKNVGLLHSTTPIKRLVEIAQNAINPVISGGAAGIPPVTEQEQTFLTGVLSTLRDIKRSVGYRNFAEYGLDLDDY